MNAGYVAIQEMAKKAMKELGEDESKLESKFILVLNKFDNFMSSKDNSVQDKRQKIENIFPAFNAKQIPVYIISLPNLAEKNSFLPEEFVVSSFSLPFPPSLLSYFFPFLPSFLLSSPSFFSPSLLPSSPSFSTSLLFPLSFLLSFFPLLPSFPPPSLPSLPSLLPPTTILRYSLPSFPHFACLFLCSSILLLLTPPPVFSDLM